MKDYLKYFEKLFNNVEIFGNNFFQFFKSIDLS